MSTARRTTAQAVPAHSARGPRARNPPGGVQLPLRRDRRIQLGRAEPDAVYFVESGCLTLDARLGDGRRQVLLTLFPGDAIAQSFVPPLADVGITAAMVSHLVRHHLDDLGKVQARPSLVEFHAALPRLLTRSALHTMIIGRLSGEERLATLLIDLALHLGRETPGGVAFELPLSRADMADYLALNPDTLSRLMSRFRSRNLLTMPTRRQAIARDFAALKAVSPLAGTVEQIYAAGQRAAAGAKD